MFSDERSARPTTAAPIPTPTTPAPAAPRRPRRETRRFRDCPSTGSRPVSSCELSKPSGPISSGARNVAEDAFDCPSTGSGRRPSSSGLMPVHHGSSHYGGGQLGQRLPECVDRVGELLDLLLAQVVIRLEPVTVLGVVEQLLQRRELLGDLRRQRGVLLLQEWFQSLERDARPVDVALEVVQIGPRPVLLLTGHLARGDL